jgi:DNA-binding Lrp family transcriptional regulator
MRRRDVDDDDLEETGGGAGADRSAARSDDGEGAAGRRGRGGRDARDGDEAARPVVSLDRVDRRILELLRDDGRLPVAALAERAGISRANAYTRLERLRTEGVILGFAAQVDSGRLGLGIAALILIAGRQPAWRSLREQLLHMSEVEFCAFTTGEYDALILVRVPDVETLRDVILERLQSSPAVRATQTVFVLDEVLRRPYVLP